MEPYKNRIEKGILDCLSWPVSPHGIGKNVQLGDHYYYYRGRGVVLPPHSF